MWMVKFIDLSIDEYESLTSRDPESVYFVNDTQKKRLRIFYKDSEVRNLVEIDELPSGDSLPQETLVISGETMYVVNEKTFLPVFCSYLVNFKQESGITIATDYQGHQISLTSSDDDGNLYPEIIRDQIKKLSESSSTSSSPTWSIWEGKS